MIGSIETNVPAHEYHRREFGVVSKSALDQIDQTPAHYKAWADGLERAPTKAMRFGTMLHMALLEPARFAETYVIRPDFGDCRVKENKERKAAWEATYGGRTEMASEEQADILGMLKSVMEHPAGARLLVGGEPEVTLRWKDPLTGLPCKSRADYWVKSKRFVVDIKTTEDASPKGFARSVANFRYHVQDALYRDGFRACGEPIEHFAILAVEKKAPYAVAVYTLDADAVARGYHASRSNIAVLADCLARNAWPSYSEGVEELGLPSWAA